MQTDRKQRPGVLWFFVILWTGFFVAGAATAKVPGADSPSPYATWSDNMVWVASEGETLAGPEVFRLANGRFRLFFEMSGVGIVSAISAPGDVTTWSLEDGVRLESQRKERMAEFDVGHPSVVALDAGRLRMFYQARGSAFGGAHIRSAISNDGGLTWEREGLRIGVGLDTGFIHVGTPEVWRDRHGRFRMLVSAQVVGAKGPSDIYLAESEKGLDWTIKTTPVARRSHSPTSLLLENGFRGVIVERADGGRWLAKTQDGEDWTLVAPVSFAGDPSERSGLLKGNHALFAGEDGIAYLAVISNRGVMGLRALGVPGTTASVAQRDQTGLSDDRRVDPVPEKTGPEYHERSATDSDDGVARKALAMSRTSHSVDGISTHWQLVAGQALVEEGVRHLAPDVVRLADGRFRMFTAATAQGIASAISTDGLIWEFEPGLRLAQSGEEGDAEGISSHPSVVRIGPQDLRMYYQAGDPAIRTNIDDIIMHVASAVSHDDGWSWTRENGARIPVGDGAAFQFAGHGRAWIDAGGTSHLVFSGNLHGDDGPSDLFHAVSADGLDWVVDETPLVESGHDPTVLSQGGDRWTMAYAHLMDEVRIISSMDGGNSWSQPQALVLYDERGEVLSLRDDWPHWGDVLLVEGLHGQLALYMNGKDGIVAFHPVEPKEPRVSVVTAVATPHFLRPGDITEVRIDDVDQEISDGWLVRFISDEEPSSDGLRVTSAHYAQNGGLILGVTVADTVVQGLWSLELIAPSGDVWRASETIRIRKRWRLLDVGREQP